VIAVTRMPSYEGCKGGYAGQCDDSAGFALEAHPDQPERRCDERQQGQQHERGKQEQPGRREAWCQRRPRVRTVHSNRDGRRHNVVLCQRGRHLAVAKLLAFGSKYPAVSTSIASADGISALYLLIWIATGSSLPAKPTRWW
jgi:hypothetical protein